MSSAAAENGIGFNVSEAVIKADKRILENFFTNDLHIIAGYWGLAASNYYSANNNCKMNNSQTLTYINHYSIFLI